MSAGPAPLREVRRGTALDEIILVDTTGRAWLLHAHGVHDDERARTRETALALLTEVLSR